MPALTLSARYLRNQLGLYPDWREAIVRELIQNSQDAKASHMQLSFRDEPSGAVLEFADNGTGMSREVLEQVFFALGETTKDGADTIGGFGRARDIIVFAQKAYTIRTGNLLVSGQGGHYDIVELDDHVQGCVFTIELVDETCHEVEQATTRLLRTCDLAVPLSIDARPAPRRPLPERASRILRDEHGRAWASVYVDKGGYGRLYVRVRGLTMFDTFEVPGYDDIVVELVPARAREVLTQNRSGLCSPYDRQFNQWAAQLATNRRQALRPPTPPLKVHVAGGGFLATDAKAPPHATAREQQLEDTRIEAAPHELGAVAASVRTVRAANPAAAANLAAAERAGSGQRLGHDEDRTGDAARLALGFDVFLLADMADTRVRRLERVWNPAGWDATTGRRRRALLLAWQSALATTLEALVELRPSLGRIYWAPGFCFDEDVKALHKTASNQGHVLALNPVDAEGKIAYQLTQTASVRELAALALHEVAHVVVDNHDEAFASVLTELHARVDQQAMLRTMRQAAARA
jgi:hypothetical protein